MGFAKKAYSTPRGFYAHVTATCALTLLLLALMCNVHPRGVSSFLCASDVIANQEMSVGLRHEMSVIVHRS